MAYRYCSVYKRLAVVFDNLCGWPNVHYRRYFILDDQGAHY